MSDEIHLITGACGFLGSHIVKRLVARGDRVRALDLARGGWDRLRGLDQSRIETVQADITDRAAVEKAMLGVSRVSHVAALYELGTADPARMEAINVKGSENVLGAAAAKRIPAVHVSTVAALGPTAERLVGEEHWNGAKAGSAYEETKRKAHLFARGLIKNGAAIRLALPATIYGAGDPSLVGKAHAWLAKGRLRIGVKPDMLLCFVHVEDCADGVIRVGDRGKRGEEYILSADVVTFRQWFEAYARATGRSAPRIYLPQWLVKGAGLAMARVPPRFGQKLAPLWLLRDATAMSDDQHWAFTGAKARLELGWSPRSFELGLAEVAAYCLGQLGREPQRNTRPVSDRAS